MTFTSFVMFAGMRTGSNFLEASLNTLDGVTCHGEVFNPLFMGKRNCESLFGHDIAAREADPLAVLASMRAETEGLSGFRCFHDHDARVIEHVLNDPACGKIILTRNPLESYVSLRIAVATDQWRLTNASRLKRATAHFDPAEFEAHLDANQQFQLHLMRRLQVSGQTAFYIDYEDIADPEVLNGLARFLGVKGRLEGPDPRLKKQNPEPLADKVENFEDMVVALAGLDRFNLSRTPNFEPRRGPVIPGYVAAAGAGLLHMPVRGGPEAAVNDWLDRVGSGGTIDGFVKRSLRDWKASHPVQRSFAVLRHPLPRAYIGYCRVVLGGRNDLHRLMTRAYGLDLPVGPDVTPAAQRAGFLSFLRWLRVYLAGQTGQKIDGHLASQTAALQGFAQFQTPDVVLREDRLAEGLTWLAAEVGVPAPEYRAVDDDLPIPLREIWDSELEDAAREAYARDYQSFGFRDWGKTKPTVA